MSQIEFSKVECEMCNCEVFSIDLEKISIDIGEFWACDDCRKELRDAKQARKEILGSGK